MNKIAVLIDYTEGCKIAIEQAVVLAQQINAELYAVNIAPDGTDSQTAQAALLAFAGEVVNNRVVLHASVGHGDVMHNSGYVLSHIDPKLVVVGTHGIKGIKQHLFGAHILKLVQSILYPTIVVQENTKVNPDGFQKILFPVGPHRQYHIKVEQTALVAGIKNASVVQYEIERAHIEPNEYVVRNKRVSKEYFAEKNVNFTEVLEETNVISLGYSRQTIQYAIDHKFDLISVMADVPEDDIYFGRTDKENILTNAGGIPVLCCNK